MIPKDANDALREEGWRLEVSPDGSSDDGRGAYSLHGITTYPKAPGKRPVVVICHGFKGFMEWGFFPYLAHLLAERGFAAVRFNMWGTGMAPGDERVTDTDAFRANTFTREARDLAAVLAALGREIAPGRVDPENVGLLGHSRGGAAVVGAAARDAGWQPDRKAVAGFGVAGFGDDGAVGRRGDRSGDRTGDWTGGRIKALVTWNGIGTVDRFGAETMERWRSGGELPIKNGRTGQSLLLGPELLAETENPPPHLDLAAAARARKAPWLIVHGAEDESVPLAEGEALAWEAASPASLEVVPGGSHTFGARHPFAGPTPALIQAMNRTQEWFRRYLKP